MVGAAGGVYLAIDHPKTLDALVEPVAQIVGIIAGLSIAGLAVQAAFMDQAFLRKLRAINRDPVRYLAPLLFTAALGVTAAIATIAVGGIPATAPTPLRASAAGAAGLFTFWMLGSILHNLTTLIQFVTLQADAAEVDDDLPVLRPGTPRAGNDR